MWQEEIEQGQQIAWWIICEPSFLSLLLAECPYYRVINP
jgi:hypothetical protein